ncbi:MULTISPECIES: hypothetical protein [Yersinia]|uniref:Phage protein n=1 Tax=Yersinia kristensenii TaxID=28152 RepID=A0AB73NJP6_YERKR|nr:MULTISPECIES: hypothetical protein [Yersinia]HDL7398666.1 hypothetical protein [Yersinia enterocolitica]MDN0106263.1 hypothetical protein [Yersinia rochesterensis]OVZ80948.1 hypothetical protein CBW52_07500 [Yersinia kristensenii]PJG60967.1 hypothetical protein CV016_20185 [Yersinia kristensenii]CNK96447.1 Uncharacterised protein [Yersinia kristensenii]
MFELTNLHTSPLTVTDDETGQRITIAVGHSAAVNGDFTRHLFTQAGMMRAEQFDAPLNEHADDSELDIIAVRDEYETLFGKKAPSAAKASTLQKAIDTKKVELALHDNTGTETPQDDADNTDNPSA